MAFFVLKEALEVPNVVILVVDVDVDRDCWIHLMCTHIVFFSSLLWAWLSIWLECLYSNTVGHTDTPTAVVITVTRMYVLTHVLAHLQTWRQGMQWAT